MKKLTLTNKDFEDIGCSIARDSESFTLIQGNLTDAEFAQAKEKFKAILRAQGFTFTSEDSDQPEALSLTKRITYIKQGTATNELASIDTRKGNMEYDPISGLVIFKKGDFILMLDNFKEIKALKTSTRKLLDALIETATAQNMKAPEISIPLKDFMAMRGLSDEKTARDTIKKDLDTLAHTYITFTQERRGKRLQDYMKLGIIGTHGIEKGKICAAFDSVFWRLLNTPEYRDMPYPKQIYSINDKQFVHAYYFCRKIFTNKFMNYFENNADILSVRTLLECTPFMPSYDEVYALDRHFDRRIIEPFCENMDALVDQGILQEWAFYHPRGVPLSDSELQLDYDTFINLTVHFVIKDYPERKAPERPKTLRLKKALKASKDKN